MQRILKGWSGKLSPTWSGFAGGAGLVLLLAILLRQGNSPTIAQPLHASATQVGTNFAMATGTIDEAVEGVFFLDRVTGGLQCWVLSKNTRNFVGKFGYTSVLNDVGAKDEKNPQLMLVTGNFQMVGGGGKLANCLVYVMNDSNGKFAVYSVPWNSMLHAKGPVPVVAPMTLVNTGMTRDPEMFRE